MGPPGKRIWRVKFLGEAASDAGGPYRESIWEFCHELHSDKLPLFIKTPNARFNVCFWCAAVFLCVFVDVWMDVHVCMCVERNVNSFLKPPPPPPRHPHTQAGENRDCWIVNPGATSDLNMKFFEFVGRMMGMGLRTKNFLDLRFPSVVWKSLLRKELVFHDFAEFDVLAANSIKFLLKDEQKGMNASNFKDVIDEVWF